MSEMPLTKEYNDVTAEGRDQACRFRFPLLLSAFRGSFGIAGVTQLAQLSRAAAIAAGVHTS